MDANEGWNAETYAELAPDLLRLEITVVEQTLPVENGEVQLEMERLYQFTQTKVVTIAQVFLN